MASRKRKMGGNGGSRKKRRIKADYEGESIPARAPGPSYTEAGRPQRTTRAMLNVNHPHFNPNFTREMRDDPDRRSPAPSPPPSPSLPPPSPPAIPNENDELEPPVQAPPYSPARPGTPEQPEVQNTPGAPDAGNGFSPNSEGSLADTPTPLPGQERRPSGPYPRPPVTPDRPIVRSGQPVATNQPGAGVEDWPDNDPRLQAVNDDDPFADDGSLVPQPVDPRSDRSDQPSKSTPAVSSSPVVPTITNLPHATLSPDCSSSSSSPSTPSVANLSHANFSPVGYSSPVHLPTSAPPGHLTSGGGGGTNGGSAGSSSGAASGLGTRTDLRNDDSGRDNDRQGPSRGNSAGSPADDDDANDDDDLTPSEAAREEELERRREWWFRHMAACSEPRRAEIIVRRARRLHTLPMPASHDELVRRADMYRLLRESVENYVPEALQPRVWRILDNDEPGDDENSATSHYEGEDEDCETLEKAQENQDNDKQRSEEEEEEKGDEEMTEPDDERDNSSSSCDDDDYNPPAAPGATGGSNSHGNGGSGHGQSRPSSQGGRSNAPGHTPSIDGPQRTSNRTIESCHNARQPLPDLSRLRHESQQRLGAIQRMLPAQMREAVMAWEDDLNAMPTPTSDENVDQRREAERLSKVEEPGVNGHMRDGEARARLDAMTGLPEPARDSFSSIMNLARNETRFDAIVGRIRTLRQLPPFPKDVDQNEDPAVQELNVLRRIIPDILPDALVADAMEIVDEEDGPGSANPCVGGDIQFRASDRDLGPVLTDEDIQRNEQQPIRYLLSLPTVGERDADVLRRAREVRGHFVRQQELRGRFPEAVLNDEWRRWLLEWHVWNDDVSTLVPESDLWFRVDRILTGADGDLDQEIIAERRNDEASDIMTGLEQSLPDYAFLDDELPVRMAELFRRIIVSRTADARARLLIDRAFQLRRMETLPQDDPRGLEIVLLRRMAPWLLPPRLLDIVMPVLNGEVEEHDAPDMSPISDDDTNSPPRSSAEAPEVVEADDDFGMSPDQHIQHQPVAPVPDMGQPQASQTPPMHHSSTVATVTTTITTTTTATASLRGIGRDPAEVAAAVLGINLHGPPPTPPVIDPMPEYDIFGELGLGPEPFYDGNEESPDDEEDQGIPPAPVPLPRFPLSVAARQQRLERALEEYRDGAEGGGEDGGGEEEDDGTGGIE